MNRKGCPLLIQSDTNPSLTVSGQSWTRTYMLRCVGEKCAAYNPRDGFCERFQTTVTLKEAMKIEKLDCAMNEMFHLTNEMFDFITELPSGLDGFESDFDVAFRELEKVKSDDVSNLVRCAERAAKIIVGYCNKQDNCDKFRFANESGGCKLMDVIPQDWEALNDAD